MRKKDINRLYITMGGMKAKRMKQVCLKLKVLLLVEKNNWLPSFGDFIHLKEFKEVELADNFNAIKTFKSFYVPIL